MNNSPPTPSTRNVLRVYRAASPQDVERGRAWYDEARALAGELDPADPERAAAVIAVLSANTGWARNVQLARNAYALAGPSGFCVEVDYIAESIGTLHDAAYKAALILTGRPPASVVSGPKVTAFWHAIADPDSTHMVVDRHAYHISVGRRLDVDQFGVRIYRQVAECYRRAALILTRELGRVVTAIEVQAVTWVAWRRIHSIDRRYDGLTVVA